MITTPSWLGSSTRFSDSVAIPPVSLCAPERAQVDVRERVTRDDQERLVPEELAHVAHAAGRTEQLLLVRVREPDAVLATVAEALADQVREVVQVGDHVVEAVPHEQAHDVLHHRPAEHRHHRLR